ncbi:MAG: ribbon-helix-helix protein, CopG family [Coriobacteriales bacterium]|jgi:predicted DNA binding CopG/RHH family protein|nr:ribbon-helix-helix protein, CopG family [Coriobacteriales bacterium]
MGYVKKDGSLITDTWMDAIADAAEADRLRGVVVKTESGPGRPRILKDDELQSITFRIGKSRLPMIDNAAAKRGESRSEFLRDLIDQALAAS